MAGTKKGPSLLATVNLCSIAPAQVFYCLSSLHYRVKGTWEIKNHHTGELSLIHMKPVHFTGLWVQGIKEIFSKVRKFNLPHMKMNEKLRESMEAKGRESLADWTFRYLCPRYDDASMYHYMCFYQMKKPRFRQDRWLLIWLHSARSGKPAVMPCFCGCQISLFCTTILCYCTGKNESR